MKDIFATLLYISATLATSIPHDTPNPPDSNLTLILSGSGDNQYWLLNESNLPPSIPLLNTSTKISRKSPQPNANTESVECHGWHQASEGECRKFMLAIRNNRASIPDSPRDIRYRGCYVSWSKPATGSLSFFYDAFVEIYNACERNGWISGLKRKVNIGGTLLTQCLSGRPWGCRLWKVSRFFSGLQ
ncbi:uncharacterized protein BDR25DRAFT_364381 [Lindgomyces ingoldianus]|uniref:Uncharacterized protein n=1 Tax=Lindgomyces ingoldianus TaxID=673940 RepID=A0ACB6RDW8_9PLEO|nr:uncharacterized protein BDR25DRAFT_364381 [Lindgomyces ingoldianus]KAF2477528.1 hypothetical protein BDR25DRAFT_364381 [Lindgomyces ingoldianus]